MAYFTYAVINTITNRSYFGFSSLTPAVRQMYHWSYLFSYKRHPNKEMQADAIEYGPSAFQFVVFETNLTKAQALEAETTAISDNSKTTYNDRKSGNPTPSRRGNQKYKLDGSPDGIWAILTMPQVEKIRELRGKMKGYEIAKMFNVSPPLISKVFKPSYGNYGKNIPL